MSVRGSKRWAVARVAVVAAAVGVVTACSDGTTEPKTGVAGEWQLAMVNGEAVPAVYLTYGLTGATKLVLGGTLHFSNGGSVVDARELREQTYQAEPADWTTTGTFSYSVSGDRIIIDRPNPAAPATSYADPADFTGDAIILRVRTVDGTPNQNHTFTYFRQ